MFLSSKMNSIDMYSGRPLWWNSHGPAVWLETVTLWNGKRTSRYWCDNCGARWTYDQQYDTHGPFCDAWLEKDEWN